MGLYTNLSLSLFSFSNSRYSHSCLTAAMLMEFKGLRALRRTLSTCLHSWRDSRVSGVVTRQKAARVFTAALPTPLTVSSDDGLSALETGWSRMPCASAKCRTSCAFARNSYTRKHTVLTEIFQATCLS